MAAAGGSRWLASPDGTGSTVSGSRRVAASAGPTYVARSGAVAPAIDMLSGGTWTADDAPLPGGTAQGAKQIAYLTLVACPASGNCLTVGSYTAGGGGTQGLIETAVATR